MAITKNELIKMGWVTIGGRALDYLNMLKNDGVEKTWNEIEKVYKEDTASVLTGIIVLRDYGPDAYYQHQI